jgi:adenosylmethionine---8-amino-7-oxononanoate aminotransferase
MKHHETFPLVPVARGSGVWLYGPDGERYLDAVSSWWTNLFGHADAAINAAIADQLAQLPHAMLAGLTHEPAIRLAERLAARTQLGHAFFASDGASVVEIALKMSVHYWANVGQPQKREFVALADGYHGETLGALSVTDVALFRDAYGPLIRASHFVPAPLPTEPSECEPCCAACVVAPLAVLEKLLARSGDRIAGFIVEPLVQGASGMRMYHPDYLKGARQLCDHYRVHWIADEIMTGFGRTGSFLAVDHAGVRPDFVTLSKGITGGYLPLSVVLTTDAIYQAFYADSTARGFLHSHSYTGSALACAAANAVLDRFDANGGQLLPTNAAKAASFAPLLEPLRQLESVRNLRQLGMIWAFEVDGANPDFARKVFALGLKEEILLRPIGPTVYFMPPYCIDAGQFAHLVNGTVRVLQEVRA